MFQLRGLGDGWDCLMNPASPACSTSTPGSFVSMKSLFHTGAAATQTKPPSQDLTWCPLFPNDPGCATYLATAPGQKVPGTNVTKPPAAAACGGSGCPPLPTAGTQINPYMPGYNPLAATVSPPFMSFTPGWYKSWWGLGLLAALGYGAYKLAT